MLFVFFHFVFKKEIQKKQAPDHENNVACVVSLQRKEQHLSRKVGLTERDWVRTLLTETSKKQKRQKKGPLDVPTDGPSDGTMDKKNFRVA